MQFFDNTYPSDDTAVRELKASDAEVHQYYDLRDTERPVDAFSDQIASLAEDETALDRGCATPKRKDSTSTAEPPSSTPVTIQYRP